MGIRSILGGILRKRTFPSSYKDDTAAGFLWPHDDLLRATSKTASLDWLQDYYARRVARALPR